VTGHAEYAEEGQDIVCAAVSALVQMIPIALEKRPLVRYQCLQRPGIFRLRFVNSGAVNGHEGHFLVESVLYALHEIENNYAPFIKIDDKGR